MTRRTVRRVSAARPEDRPGAAAGGGPAEEALAALLPVVGRVVGARVADRATAEDLVQETLARVLAAADRVEPGMLEPYAIATARNLVATLWKEKDRTRRHQHRLVELRPVAQPDEGLLADEESGAMARALRQLPETDRRRLLAHEVAGQDTRSLAGETGSTAGAVAAQLNRTRARLRVEYLLEVEGAEPPTPQCRPVLLALSSGDRRRQREVDADGHLLGCALCSGLSVPLLERGAARDDRVRVAITTDGDIVGARQAARELAGRLGLSRTDLTVVATAVSEVARNIVRFAGSGEVALELVETPRAGLRVVARDAGPGIPDVAAALADGYSTSQGLGLGLPGARRLMDEFTLASQPGQGTTVTMTKWAPER
jgi:serine/threonine-protein kinase RsbT